MPEGTSNQLLRDTLVRRQIYLQRYSATLSRDITALLDDTEKQVRDTIERRLAALEGKDFSATTNSRLNVLANALEKLRRDAFNGANEMWDEHLQALAVAEAEFLDSAIKDVSPVILDTTMPDPVHLGSIVSTQPMQGHLLEDWASGLASKDVDRMMASVRTGIAQGSTTDEIVRGILGSASMDGADGILEMTRKDIRSITHTAVQTVAGEARQAYAEANSDIIPKEQYTATLDSRTTIECAALDGEVFDVGEGPMVPLHWNCRSVRVPILDGAAIGDRPATSAFEDDLAGLDKEERAARVSELTGRVPGTTTYQAFLGRQTNAFQEEVLGTQRAALFRDGGLTLDRFTDRKNQPYTLNQLRTREPEAFQRIRSK